MRDVWRLTISVISKLLEIILHYKYKQCACTNLVIHDMPTVVEGLIVEPPRLQKPFRLIVAGGSGSGKTCFVKKLVEKNHFQTEFCSITYIYPDYLQEPPCEFDTEQNIECFQGLPDKSTLAAFKPNSLIILDDMMMEATNNDDIARLFMVIARKLQISIILIVQNIYHQAKQFRNLRLNATGIALFKFYGGVDTNFRIIRDLGLNEYIKKPLMNEIYSKKYSYIYLDLHPNRQNDFCAVRGNIFKNYYSIYYKMEYVAIPKSDFIKYFKIIESKKGKVKVLKNEIKIKANRRRRRSSSDSEEDQRTTKKRKDRTRTEIGPESSEEKQGKRDSRAPPSSDDSSSYSESE